MASSSSNTSSKTTSGSKTNTSGTSNTVTQGASTSQTAGTSQSYGGSSSTTNSSTHGGSHSVTNTTGGSVSDTTSKGGANSQTNGKSWASGAVDADIQAAKKYYESGYSQSQQVADTYNRLQDTLNNKPDAFSSSYTDKLNNLYDQIMNRDKFSYNFNADPMYRMYRDQYINQGKSAMQDTMGQAAALTGGYGSSYSQTAGQQTYQNYLTQLNNMIPELRDQAYEEWLAEGEDLKDKYNLTQNAYDNEYNQYRDKVSDWQADRSFDLSNYQSDRDFDYSKFTGDRSYFQNEYWNQRNAEQSNTSNTDQTNWSQSHTNESNWSTATTDSTNWSNTTSNTNSTNWSNTASNSVTANNSISNSTTNESSQSNTTGWSNTNSSTSQWSSDSGSSSGSSSKSGSSSNGSYGFDYTGDGNGNLTIDRSDNGSTSVKNLNVMSNKSNRDMITNVLDDKTEDEAKEKINGWLKNGYNGREFTETDALYAMHLVGLDQ